MTSPLAVHFVLQDVPALYGAERATLALMQAFRARGVAVEVRLIGESRLGREPAALAQAVAAAELPARRYEMGGRFSWSFIRALRAEARASPGLIFHTVGYKAHLHAVLASRGCAAAVTTIHGWLLRPEIKERLYEAIEARLLRHDEAVICLSSYYERMLLERGVRRERLHRIPTGLDPAAWPAEPAAAAWPDAPFTVALIGRLSWEKNHDLLLRAARRLRDEGIDLRIVLAGEGPEQDRIKDRVRALALADVARMPGYIEMPALMPSVHAVVLCSHIENMPLSLLEAMAWGRPVVGTRVGGIPDLIADGETGILTPDNDEVALAAALRRLAGDPAAAREMGRAGRRRVEKEFVLPLCVERHLALYRQLAGDRGG